MAILSGTIDTSGGRVGIETGYGTLRVELTDGTEYFLNFDKIPAGLVLDQNIVAELLGSSWAIEDATAPTSGAFIGESLSTSQQNWVGGIGKINIPTSSGTDRWFGIDELTFPLTVTPANTWELGQGAVIFVGADDAAPADKVPQADAEDGDTIHAGKGMAEIEDADGNKFTIRLNEINYPFTLVTGESLTCLGSSPCIRRVI